jgi:hypothetical protein
MIVCQQFIVGALTALPRALCLDLCKVTKGLIGGLLPIRVLMNVLPGRGGVPVETLHKDSLVYLSWDLLTLFLGGFL